MVKHQLNLSHDAVFPDEEIEEIHQDRVERMTKMIMGESVQISYDLNLNVSELIDWCKLNIGTARPYHPIHEAREG